MNTKYIYQALILIYLSASFFSSCTEASFTKIVEVDFAEEDKQLAVVARMNTTVDAQQILVSETLSVLDNSNNFSSLSGAKISLTTPDAGIITPTFDSDINLYSLSDYTFVAGEEYKIEVDHPEYAPMSATIKAPTAPEIISLDVDVNDEDPLTVTPDIIKIKFRDPPNEANSYLFEGRIHYTDDINGDDFYDQYSFEISENILEYNDEVITDITFNGKEYELTLLGYRGFRIDDKSPTSIEIKMTSISEELLLYENSVDQAYDANDNPFVEPSTIYTNFDNGFGIFTIDAIQTIKRDL